MTSSLLIKNVKLSVLTQLALKYSFNALYNNTLRNKKLTNNPKPNLK